MSGRQARSDAALAVLACAVVGLVTACSGSSSASSSLAAGATGSPSSRPAAGSPSPSPAPAATSAGQPTTAAPRADEVPVLAVRPGAAPPSERLAAPTVPFDAPAAFPDGVTVRVRDVAHAVTSDTGAGARPGQDVTTLAVELVNGSPRPVDLSGVVVAVTHGPDRVRADPVYGGGQEDFSGAVPRGGRAAAVYAFALPRKARGDVTLTVDFDGRHAPAVWRGAVD